MSQYIDLGNTDSVLFNGLDVEILRLNDSIIWQKYVEIKDLIYNVSFTSVNYKSPTLKFTKQDTQPTTINWGDGSAVETITTSGTQAVNHTYETLGDYTITISGEGKINIDAGALGSEYNDTSTSSIGYPASLNGLVIGSIVDRIEDDAFINTNGVQTIMHPNISYIGDYNFDSGGYDNIMSKELYMYNENGEIQDLYEFFYFISEDGVSKYGIYGDLNAGTYESTKIPNGIILLASGCITNAKNITIPSTVKYFGNACLNSTGYLRFEQPLGMEVFLPQAGDGTGLSYSKNAVERNIYTDNETIKNYNWAGDNITATLYHLDGTLWE